MQPYTTDEYRATAEWPYAIAAGTVVYRQLKNSLEVLLLKRTAGEFPQLKDGHIDSYHLPKGHVVIHEALEQTALRETLEEAGCSVLLTTYLGAKLHSYHDQTITKDKVIHYFAGLWQADAGQMDKEHSDKLWVSADKAIALIGTINPKREDEIIMRLLKFLELTGAA